MKVLRLGLRLVLLTLLWPGLFLAGPFALGVLSAQTSAGEISGVLGSVTAVLSRQLMWVSVFLPMGFVSALCFVVLSRHAGSRAERQGIRLGYLLASPVALFGALTSGLVLPLFLGPLIYGALPLVGGTLAGYDLAKYTSEQRGTITNAAFHLRALAWLWAFYSVMQGLFATAGIFFGEGSPGPGRIHPEVLLWLAGWLAVQCVGFAGGIAAMRGRGWSVYLLFLAAIVNVMFVPVGTLLSLYTLLYVLWLIVRLIVRRQSR